MELTIRYTYTNLSPKIFICKYIQYSIETKMTTEINERRKGKRKVSTKPKNIQPFTFEIIIKPLMTETESTMAHE